MLNHSKNCHNCWFQPARHQQQFQDALSAEVNLTLAFFLLLILFIIHYLLVWGGVCTCRTCGYSNTPWSNNNNNNKNNNNIKQINLSFSKNLLLNKLAWHYGWKLTGIGSGCKRALPLIASCLYMIYSLQPGFSFFIRRLIALSSTKNPSRVQ